MTTLDAQTNVCEWVTENSRCASVFDKYQIDYCCGGNVALSKACEAKGIPVGQVLEDLFRLMNDDSEEQVNWASKSLTELIEHIENKHHRFLRDELPSITKLLEKVATRHKDGHPELALLESCFLKFNEAIVAHMLKEEQVLFPIIREMETDKDVIAIKGDSVRGPIEVMKSEHDSAGNDLKEMRELTSEFTPPEGACMSYSTLYKRLDGLAQDTMEHVHKENNILFPRILELVG